MNDYLTKLNKRNFYNIADTKVAFFFAVLIPQAIGILLSFIIIGAGMEETYASNPLIMVLFASVSQISFISIYFLYNFRMGIRQFRASGLSTKISKRNLILSALLGVVCIFGLNYLIEFVMQVFEAFGYQSSGLALPLDNIGWYFANVFLLAVLPAICEELIFRGIILNGLLSKYKPVTAVVFSAILFALMHGNIEQLVFPMLMGLVLGYVFFKTGSLLCTMILHFVNNFIVITINYIVVSSGAALTEMPMLMTFIIGVQLALVTVAIICFTDRFWKPREKRLRVKPQKESETGNTLFWVGIAICSFFLLMSIFI